MFHTPFLAQISPPPTPPPSCFKHLFHFVIHTHSFRSLYRLLSKLLCALLSHDDIDNCKLDQGRKHKCQGQCHPNIDGLHVWHLNNAKVSLRNLFSISFSASHGWRYLWLWKTSKKGESDDRQHNCDAKPDSSGDCLWRHEEANPRHGDNEHGWNVRCYEVVSIVTTEVKYCSNTRETTCMYVKWRNSQLLNCRIFTRSRLRQPFVKVSPTRP